MIVLGLGSWVLGLGSWGMVVCNKINDNRYCEDILT